MPIPSSDELLVKEEIKSAILQKAFEELARELALRDRAGFDRTVDGVLTALRSFPVARFVPPESALANSVDIKRIQQEGFSLAVEACKVTLDRLKKARRSTA